MNAISSQDCSTISFSFRAARLSTEDFVGGLIPETDLQSD
jgi:hypothetical protein